MPADASLGGREAVERKDEGVVQDMVGRSPGARGGREASLRLLPRGRVTDEELVDPSVVVPFEFSDHRSASIGAGDAHRVEGRLGPGDGEAHPSVRMEDAEQPLGVGRLQFVRRPEHRRAGGIQDVAQRLHDPRMSMSQDQRSEGQAVVEVLVAV